MTWLRQVCPQTWGLRGKGQGSVLGDSVDPRARLMRTGTAKYAIGRAGDQVGSRWHWTLTATVTLTFTVRQQALALALLSGHAAFLLLLFSLSLSPVSLFFLLFFFSILLSRLPCLLLFLPFFLSFLSFFLSYWTRLDLTRHVIREINKGNLHPPAPATWRRKRKDLLQHETYTKPRTKCPSSQTLRGREWRTKGNLHGRMGKEGKEGEREREQNENKATNKKTCWHDFRR